MYGKGIKWNEISRRQESNAGTWKPPTTEHRRVHRTQQQVLFTSYFTTLHAINGERKRPTECQSEDVVPPHDGTEPLSVQGSDGNGCPYPAVKHEDQGDF